MDALEKNIKAQQNALESVEQPDLTAIWQGIQIIPPRPRRRGWLAAVALLLLLAGAGAGYWFGQKKQAPPAPAIQYADLPPEWRDKVQHYQQLAGQKEALLRTDDTGGTSLAEALHELALLDSIQSQFMADYQTLPKDENTALRLLHYYEQKVRILELIIKDIQVRKNEQERSYEKQI